MGPFQVCSDKLLVANVGCWWLESELFCFGESVVIYCLSVRKSMKIQRTKKVDDSYVKFRSLCFLTWRHTMGLPWMLSNSVTYCVWITANNSWHGRQKVLCDMTMTYKLRNSSAEEPEISIVNDGLRVDDLYVWIFTDTEMNFMLNNSIAYNCKNSCSVFPFLHFFVQYIIFHSSCKFS